MGSLCGFLGDNDRKLLEAMNNLQSHRGKRTDYYEDDDISFATRAIEEEAAIVRIADGVIAFHGEIYDLRNMEHQFDLGILQSTSLANVASAIRALGRSWPETFAKLRGSYTAAIWDSSQRALTLARDHLGQDTLYYSQIDDRLFFASEIKPLLFAQKSILSTNPCMDHKALTQYLRYGYVPSPSTLFRNIRRLPAASYIYYSERKLNGPNRHWTPHFSPENLNERQAMDKIYDEILRIVQLGVQRHKKFAVLLSGGLDSSLLASFVRKDTDDKIDSYTFTPFGQTNPSARNIADFLNLTHHEVAMDAKDAIEAFTMLPKIYADLISDPFIALPTYALAEAAKDEGAVFAADGADNIFWGLPALYDNFRYVRNTQRLPSTIRGLFLEIAEKFRTVHPFQRSLENLLAASLSEDPYMDMIRIFTDREIEKLFPVAHLMSSHHKPVPENNHALTLTDFYSRQEATAPERPANIARIGPMCSHFALKLFEPFLDVKVVELANKIPPSMKQPSRNKDKLVLRRMAQQFEMLPKDFHQKKAGLSCPLDYWYERDMKEWANQILTDELPAFFNKDYVRSLLNRGGLLDRIYSGSATHRTSSRDIFTILMFALWFKEYSPETDF
jgi:asparagine synthase (glutamine-hydrolysing)